MRVSDTDMPFRKTIIAPGISTTPSLNADLRADGDNAAGSSLNGECITVDGGLTATRL